MIVSSPGPTSCSGGVSESEMSPTVVSPTVVSPTVVSPTVVSLPEPQPAATQTPEAHCHPSRQSLLAWHA